MLTGLIHTAYGYLATSSLFDIFAQTYGSDSYGSGPYGGAEDGGLLPGLPGTGLGWNGWLALALSAIAIIVAVSIFIRLSKKTSASKTD